VLGPLNAVSKPDKGKAPTKQKAKNQVDVTITGTAFAQEVTLSSDDALAKIFGTDNPDMASALLGHCIKVLRGNEATDEEPAHDERAFMLASVAGIEPHDTVESMLAVQMAAIHVALVRSARWLAGINGLEQAKAHYSGYNKLARTFTAQMEALRKHRNWGKQTVVVQHVNMNEGGQVIVGNVETGGRGNGEK